MAAFHAGGGQEAGDPAVEADYSRELAAVMSSREEAHRQSVAQRAHRRWEQRGGRGGQPPGSLSDESLVEATADTSNLYRV